MSITIDKKLLRKYLSLTDICSSIPMSLPNYYSWAFTWSYDGEWIAVTTIALSYYPSIRSTVAQESGSLTTSYLQVCANIKAPTATSIYFFFYEPTKGDYPNYQGLDTRDGAEYNARSRNSGAETKTILAGQDWTVERKFMISHQKDQSDVYFYIDGVEVAHHTTNISAQPYEVACCEPNGVLRTVYLRYPKGLYVDKV